MYVMPSIFQPFSIKTINLKYVSYCPVSFHETWKCFLLSSTNIIFPLVQVHGGWTEYTASAPCPSSSACGKTRIVTRNCTNPEPQYGGEDCQGPSTEVDVCKPPGCPGKVGSSCINRPYAYTNTN